MMSRPRLISRQYTCGLDQPIETTLQFFTEMYNFEVTDAGIRVGEPMIDVRLNLYDQNVVDITISAWEER